jgi:hypothetical protein
MILTGRLSPRPRPQAPRRFRVHSAPCLGRYRTSLGPAAKGSYRHGSSLSDQTRGCRSATATRTVTSSVACQFAQPPGRPVRRVWSRCEVKGSTEVQGSTCGSSKQLKFHSAVDEAPDIGRDGERTAVKGPTRIESH